MGQHGRAHWVFEGYPKGTVAQAGTCTLTAQLDAPAEGHGWHHPAGHPCGSPLVTGVYPTQGNLPPKVSTDRQGPTMGEHRQATPPTPRPHVDPLTAATARLPTDLTTEKLHVDRSGTSPPSAR